MSASSGNIETEDIIAQIHLWIFEHSFKHGMRNVTKRVLSIFKKESSEEKKCHLVESIKGMIKNWRRVDSQDPHELPPVNEDILFLFFTDKLKTLINDIKFDANGNALINLDFELLNLVIDMIVSINRRSDLMAFNTFARFISRLKLLELICRIALKEPTSVVMHRLKILFPLWDDTYEKEIIKKIKVPDNKALEKLREAHKRVRNNILQVLISEEKRQDYLGSSFKTDIKDIAHNVTKHLCCFPKYAEGKLPPTAIEQIVDGAYLNTNLEKEPAIRILLDHLNPNLTAKDLLTILDKLSPDSKVVCMNSCFAEFSDSDGEELEKIENIKSNEDGALQHNANRSFFAFEDNEEDLFLPQSRKKKSMARKSTSNSMQSRNSIKTKTEVSPSKSRTSRDDTAVRVLLPVKRRLYSESSTDDPSTSGCNGQEISHECRMTRSKNKGPAPKSVKRKWVQTKQHESPSKVHKSLVKIEDQDVQNSPLQRFSPGSPFKRKTSYVSLSLKGRLVNSDGSITNFFT